MRNTKSTKAAWAMLAALGAIPTFAATYTVMGWGENDYGQLGNGTITTALPNGISTPVSVSGLSDVAAISAGKITSLALKGDGTVWVWGFLNSTASNSDIPVQESGVSGVVAVASGRLHSLVLKNDGTLWGWGDNSAGELGITGFPNGQPKPVQVVGISGVVAIAAGDNYSMALKSDGTVWAWGDPNSGDLGIASLSGNPVPTPTQVIGLTGVVAIAAGYANHSLALKSDGTVWAWGDNVYGELGNGTTTNSNVPLQVPGLTGMVAIATGYEYSLALKSDGTVWAWGLNFIGELGTGTLTNHSVVPVLSAISGVVAISEGTQSLALKSDGTVWTWGNNQYGDLGNGTNMNSATPVLVSGLSGVGAISSGEEYGLVLLPGVGSTSQTITFTQPSSQTLGTSPFALNATASSGLPVAFVSKSPSVCTVLGSTVTLVGVGTCSITASQPGNVAYAAAPAVTQTFTITSTAPATFFNGEASLGSGVYYLQFPDGNLFGYLNFVAGSIFYHYDMGYEAFVPGSGADIYLYDFTSGHWWYTSTALFPDLYDFTLNAWIYYFPDTKNSGHYTANPRYFSNLTTGKIFTM